MTFLVHYTRHGIPKMAIVQATSREEAEKKVLEIYWSGVEIKVTQQILMDVLEISRG